jgi:hypothetical protein
MKNQLISSIVITIAAITAGQAIAQANAAPNTPRVDRREAQQQTRIDQGVRSGELTSKETTRLNAQQARINANEAAAKSDGKVTRAERRSLAKQQNHASRKIYRAKHNQRKA